MKIKLSGLLYNRPEHDTKNFQQFTSLFLATRVAALNVSKPNLYF